MSGYLESEADRWDSGWDEHKKRQLQRIARLSLSEKLDWLEEAHRLVNTLTAQHGDRREGRTNPC